MVGKLSYYIYIDIYRYILSLQWPCHFWMATGKERCLLFSFMSSDWQDLVKPPSSCYWPIYAGFSNLSAWIFSYIRVAIFHCCTRRLEESFRVARCFTTSEHCFMLQVFLFFSCKSLTSTSFQGLNITQVSRRHLCLSPLFIGYRHNLGRWFILWLINIPEWL